MVILRCKICGGDVDISADKTFGMCECCGNAMTFPKVSDEQRAAAFNRGNHFRRIGEFDKALAVYERIVREDEADAEAHWCCALSRFGIEYVEDPATMEWLPTCHRASYDSFLEDVDYLAALEYSDGLTRRQYQKDAAKIAEVQKGILATSQEAEPFDVFICYKETDELGQRTRDSLLAQDIYYQLTEQGRKVFFARITLENMAGKQYEPYIFSALNSAKVMVVVGTEPEYLNAVWVKNEWSRFLAMMKKDRSKLLLPCYRDMDPYDMPEQLGVLQSYDMSKIGFIQDLIRGIAKVLDVNKPVESAREVAAPQPVNANVAPLLRRGNMALEDGTWEKAERFFDDVLNQDPECAEAYLGLFLMRMHSPGLRQHIDSEFAKMLSGVKTNVCGIDSNVEAQAIAEWRKDMVEKYCAGKVLPQSRVDAFVPPRAEPYASTTAYWKAQKNKVQQYSANHKDLYRAINFAKAQFKSEIAEQLTAWERNVDEQISAAESVDARQQEAVLQKLKRKLMETEDQIDQMYRQAEAVAEAKYLDLVRKQGIIDNAREMSNLEAEFLNMGEYRDCRERAAWCRQQIEKMAEETYAALVQRQATTEDIWGLMALKREFEAFDYRDCQQRAMWCHGRIKQIEAQRAQQEREQEAAARAAAGRMALGKCVRCGGDFGGFIVKRCLRCGAEKSY